MKKIFVVAGELSGDKIGAWYIKKLKQSGEPLEVHAVGGDFLREAGAVLYERFEKLNFVGIVEIVKHLRFILRFLNRLAAYAVSGGFDEVVVVDFPGFNLPLIKKIKSLNPEIKITYVSPPQLWVWGAWRHKKINKFVDEVVVIYPFEVDWYAKREIKARWLGYPFYKSLEKYFCDSNKKKQIAIIPGSRPIEIKRLLPLFLNVAKRLKRANQGLKIILPLAESIDKRIVKKMIRKYQADVEIVEGESEKWKRLSQCCLAITKPGTITLELALLSVPSVVAYKASFLTYLIARSVVKIEHMALPNLFLPSPVYQEFIQGDCKEEKIYQAAAKLYKGFLKDSNEYNSLVDRLGEIRLMLS